MDFRILNQMSALVWYTSWTHYCTPLQVTPTKIKLQLGDSLVVDTLRGNVALSAFRKTLAGGFQVRNLLFSYLCPLIHSICILDSKGAHFAASFCIVSCLYGLELGI